MAIRTHHYEVTKPQSKTVTWEIPGFDGVVEKLLVRRTETIREYGWTDTDASTLATLCANRGDPTVTVSINTLGRGTYTCYLVDVQLIDRSIGDGSKASEVRYVRTWKPLTNNTAVLS
jgi:hypothetical protein